MGKKVVLRLLALLLSFLIVSSVSYADENIRVFSSGAYSYFPGQSSPTRVAGYKDLNEETKRTLESTGMIELISLDAKSAMPYMMKYAGYMQEPTPENIKQYNLNLMRDLKCQVGIMLSIGLEKTIDDGMEATAHLVCYSNVASFSGEPIIVKVSMSGKDNAKDVRDRVTLAAINMVADEFVSRLGGKVAGVESVNGETVKLARGELYGIQKGAFYRIFAESERHVDMFTGESSQTRADLAIIKITDTDDHTSTGIMISNGGYVGTIQPGDRFVKIEEADAKKYTRDIMMGLREDFPKTRPSELLDDPNEDDNIAAAVAGVSDADINIGATASPSGEIVPSIPDSMIRLGVMSFTSATEEVTKSEAEAITDILTRMLANSKKIAILERDRLEGIAQEHKLNVSGVVDPETAVQLGKLAGCRYMLLGSVTNIEGTSSSTGNVQFRKMTDLETMSRAINVGGTVGKVATALAVLDVFLTISENTSEKERVDTQSAAATIDARIVDVETGNIVATMSGKGSASQSTVLRYGSSTEITVNEFGGLRSQAITAASSHIGLSVREKLGGELMRAVAIDGEELTLDRGGMAGIQRGDLCVVYPADDPLPGKNVSAIVVVKDVEENFSIAGLYGVSSDISAIKRGDVLRPVTQEEIDAGNFKISDTRAKMLAAFNNGTPSSPANTSISTTVIPETIVAREHESTDPAKVIPSYGLPSNKENMLRIAHINIRKIKDKKEALAKYEELLTEYAGDYLAAYHAAEISLAIKDSEGARKWVERALSINPQYRPAQTLKAQIQ